MRELPFFLFFPLLILLSGCVEKKNDEKNKTVFRYNEAANITSLDPAFARDQANIWATHQLFNGLIQLNERLEPQPCVARSWIISEDGKEYVFHLRSDVFFHDDPAFPQGKGRRVNAADFLYSFLRITDPKVASPGSWIFNDVEELNGVPGFFAQDDSTFVIHLRKPFPPFLGLLATLYCSVVPKEAVSFYGAEFRKRPVGTGPFQFRIWKEGVKLVLVKNHRYFEFENGRRLPYLDAVAITFLSDKQSAYMEFVKGRLDFLSGIDPGYKDELLNHDGSLKAAFKARFNLLTHSYLNTEYLAFLVDRNAGVFRTTPMIPKKVRQAFNYAFDRKKMISFLRNNMGTPGVSGIIPKGMPSFDSTTVFYDYDPDKVRKLLAEAGYPGGRGLPPITLTTTSDYLDLCKYIQYQVGEAGITLKIDVSPPAAMKEMKAQAKLPFFRASWIADYPDGENYLSLFCTRNFCPMGPNYTHFSDTRFDRLYDKAMSTVNDSLRNAIYREMEKLIMEESPVVVLYYDRVMRFVQNNITGLESDPMNLLTLKSVKKKNR